MQRPAGVTIAAPNRPPPVDVRDLRKAYGDGVAVDRFSFTLQSGTITELFGGIGAGAGKSTTIAMLMRPVIPTSGSARMFGFRRVEKRAFRSPRLCAESFSWLADVVLLSVVCVSYPLSPLPGWLQSVALALPPAYVCTSVRPLVVDGRFSAGDGLWALALNGIWKSLGFLAFRWILDAARRRGSLVEMGE